MLFGIQAGAGGEGGGGGRHRACAQRLNKTRRLPKQRGGGDGDGDYGVKLACTFGFLAAITRSRSAQKHTFSLSI